MQNKEIQPINNCNNKKASVVKFLDYIFKDDEDKQVDSIEIMRCVTLFSSFYLGTLINSVNILQDLRSHVASAMLHEILHRGKNVLDRDEAYTLVIAIIDQLEKERLKQP